MSARITLQASTRADKWDGNTLTWTERTDLAGTGPAARDRHGLVTDTARGVLVLFGGRHAPYLPFGDTWEFGSEGCQPNRPPTADAGVDQTVDEGSVVTLAGIAEDLDGDPVVCTYQQVSGTVVALQTVGPCTVEFMAPIVSLGGETLSFALIVTDDSMASDQDYVDVTVSNVLKPPFADAGDDVAVLEGSPVSLDMSNSYGLDGEELSFSTVQIDGPTVVLADADTAFPSFSAPLVDAAGTTLTFQLTVSNGAYDSTDQVSVAVENVNHVPIAHAGDEVTRDEATVAFLTGAGSSDPDKDPLTFDWWVESDGGALVELINASSSSPHFTTPVVSTGGAELVFGLTVSDGDLTSEPDYVTVHVRNSNDPPSCGLASASIGVLWPPNHGLREIAIVGVSDPDDGTVSLTITGVTQDEPTNGVGDGDSYPDARFLGEELLIRAERSGVGNGRVYVVSFEAEDGLGQVCEGSVVVSVPHHRRAESVDDGQDHASGAGLSQ